MRKIRQKVSATVLLCGLVLGLSYWGISKEMATRTPLGVDVVGTPELTTTQPTVKPAMEQWLQLSNAFQAKTKALEIPEKFVVQVSQVQGTDRHCTKRLSPNGQPQDQEVIACGSLTNLQHPFYTRFANVVGPRTKLQSQVIYY